MSTCRDPIYDITHLPQVIPVGIRTEKGAAEVRFDVSVWKDKWPDMYFEVWNTRPNEDTSHPVEAMMEGDLLTWTVSEAETEIEGLGKVEVVGMTPEGVRKLSGPITTAVRATSINQPGEVPESHAPYYEALMRSNAQTQKNTKENATAAAQSAQEAMQAASAAGRYSANADAQAASAAKSAASAGVSEKAAASSAAAAAASEKTATSQASSASASATVASQSANVATQRAGESVESAQKAKSSAEASATSASAAEEYANSAKESVKDILIIKAHGEGIADKTHEEIKSAIASGKVCVLLNTQGNRTMFYRETKDNVLIFRDMDYNGTLNGSYCHIGKVRPDNTVTFGFNNPLYMANPYKLKITGAVEGEYNGAKEVVLTIPGAGLPETADPLKQLVTDKDGKVEWEDRLAYKYAVEAINLHPTEMTYMPDEGQCVLLSPWTADVVAGNVCTVNYNGGEYECKAIDASELSPDMPEGSCILGNLGAMGATGIEGSNPDAPFVLLTIPNDRGADMGMHAQLILLDDATSVTLAVRSTGEVVKTIGTEYLPDIGGTFTAHATITSHSASGIGLGDCDATFAKLRASYLAGKTVQIICTNDELSLRGVVTAAQNANGTNVMRLDVPRGVMLTGHFFCMIASAGDGSVVFEQVGWDG